MPPRRKGRKEVDEEIAQTPRLCTKLGRCRQTEIVPIPHFEQSA
jgi:hypothetical protein